MHTVKFLLRSDNSTFVIFGNVDSVSYIGKDDSEPWDPTYIIHFADDSKDFLSAELWMMIEVW